MSGIINNNLGRSGIIEGPITNDSSLQAYCVITSDSPSSGDFNMSFNISSISYTAANIQVNFTRKIDYPSTMFQSYKWSTSSSFHIIGNNALNSVAQAFVNPHYRKVASNGMTSVDGGALSGAQMVIYGGRA
jgi:tRNA G37 N-methylase Trm5